MKKTILGLLAAFAFAAVGCGVSDRDACRSLARPLAACSGGFLNQQALEQACDNPTTVDGGTTQSCTNQGAINQALVNCANAVPASPSTSDCQTFSSCLANAPVCQH